MSKTVAAKSLVRTKNVSLREAEWQLDTDAYLQEQRWWVHGASKCSSMPLQLAGVSMTVLSTEARGSHCLNET